MDKKVVSERGKKNRIIAGLVLVIFLSMIIFSTKNKNLKKNIEKLNQESIVLKKANKASKIEKVSLKENERVQLSVPLIIQTDEPSLYNGCEVASLAMLLQYNGFDIGKNELADEITTVPLTENDLMGDPHDGFVGSISGNDTKGYSAYSPVIVELAEKKIDSNFEVKDLTNQDFDDILSELLIGNPVWVITTTTFEAPKELETWKTKNGDVEISWEVHSVALTGFDSKSIYLNDPYGEKKQVDREKFIESWEKMGKQAVTISPI